MCGEGHKLMLTCHNKIADKEVKFVQPLCFTVWRETESGEKDIFRQGCSSSVKGLQQIMGDAKRFKIIYLIQGLFTTPSCQQSRCLDDSRKVKAKYSNFEN